MKAIKYKIEITRDLAHNWKNTIEEYFFPELNLFMNGEAEFFLEDQLQEFRLTHAKKCNSFESYRRGRNFN